MRKNGSFAIKTHKQANGACLSLYGENKQIVSLNRFIGAPYCTENLVATRENISIFNGGFLEELFRMKLKVSNGCILERIKLLNNFSNVGVCILRVY